MPLKQITSGCYLVNRGGQQVCIQLIILVIKIIITATSKIDVYVGGGGGGYLTSLQFPTIAASLFSCCCVVTLSLVIIF